ncbi:outer membrane autotransporter barrel [Roseibium aggregatum IAM 12614]|uniref:Outer membrane autotransporter barrel n=1 Tax=Roseibium aggregatum (strain ATCC 25650 / DSM 13394 / JCM 20685 / NBRC 16684 / NCIMB 2208 / IAM 12614 / B1) TaxID=384765 RepID=A0NPJ7_ROSAI|nr:autotransporter outer membrane beta-barrel domain-containing protein [Roseibium aggregatum]EAV45360.1 outer membrane autotransporter barrel [Roseibium aggregatum IAM 12614]
MAQLGSGEVLASDITVASGSTVTTKQTLTDVGDTGTVESGGTIDVTNQDGLVLDNDDQTATNNGTITVTKTTTGTPNLAGIGSNEDDATVHNNGSITTTGSRAFGIAGDGNDFTVTNSGIITTTGKESDAIFSLGTDSEITNSGTISTTGEAAYGINAEGDRPTVLNSGAITTTGDDAYAIDTDEDDAKITNTGTITTSGEDADGFDSDGDDVTLINTGVMTMSGRLADGIDNDGDRAAITNSGTITVSGEDANPIESNGDDVSISNSGTLRNTGTISGTDDDVGHGIAVDGDNVTITNSGRIYSTNGSSIYVDGSDATISLNEGTILQGALTFTDPTTATLNYAAGRTAILTFNGLPATLTTAGLASSTNGNTVTILNPEDFRLDTVGQTFNAMTRAVTGSIEQQMDLNRLSGTSFVATNGPAPDQENSTSIWVTPLGGVLSRQGSDSFDHAFGGLSAGAEKTFTEGLTAGIAGGFTLGRTTSDGDIHSASSYSIHAGGYLSRSWQATFAQFGLLGGYLKSDEEVTVLNNMVVGGLQDLSIDYDYVYVTPSARLGHAFALSEGTLTPSARVRYSGLWQTGSATEDVTGLSVSSRSLHVLELRAQATYDHAPIIQNGGTLYLGAKAGIDGIFTLNDSVDGTLQGAALNLSVDSDDAVLRGFAAADAVWQVNDGTRFLAGIEGGYDSADTLSASVRLAARISF